MDTSSFRNFSPLEKQLLDECRAMLHYALSQGLAFPSSLASVLETYDGRPALEKPGHYPLLGVETDTGGSAPDIPAPLTYKNQPLHDLVVLHSRLAKIIEPVKPHAAVMMASHMSSRTLLKFLGPVPLIRHMMIISILSLVGMFGISLSEAVNGDPRHFSLLQNDGVSLFVNELFLLSAASIGASFNALFVADGYARDGVWNPAYETSYWIRYVLGVLSGAMLATLVPIEQIDPASAGGAGSLNGFGGPMLALVGGFSSNVVYRILARLSETLDAMVSGGVKEKLAAQEKTSNLRIVEKTSRDRIMISARLAKLQSQLDTHGDPKRLREEFERIQHELLSPESTDGLFDIPGVGSDG